MRSPHEAFPGQKDQVGAVRFSIDPVLIQTLKRALPIDVFVETGTFEGQTIETVLPFFEEIHTCEVSEHLHAEVTKRFAEVNKLHSVLGDSGRILLDLMPRLRNRSVLFWLDAHWCADEQTAGTHSQCPLLDELEAIKELNAESVIVIDDARLFFCAPPKPYEVDQWPAFDTVLRKLYALNRDHEIMAVNDMLIFHPPQIGQHLKSYAHEHSIDWLSVLDKWRDYDVILKQSKEKETEIREKEAEILELKSSAEERATIIEQLNHSYYYRFGHALLSPLVALKNRFFSD